MLKIIFCSGNEIDGRLEQLAVRFKTKDTAVEFKKKFEECQAETGETVSETVVVASQDTFPVEETVAKEQEGEEDCEGYEEEEDYDENGETVMFQQTARLSTKSEAGVWVQQGEVDLRIVYDDDVYGARILGDAYTEDEAKDTLVCNHLIAMQTVLNEVEESLEWSALDFSLDPPTYRTFRVRNIILCISCSIQNSAVECVIWMDVCICNYCTFPRWSSPLMT